MQLTGLCLVFFKFKLLTWWAESKIRKYNTASRHWCDLMAICGVAEAQATWRVAVPSSDTIAKPPTVRNTTAMV